MDSNASNAGAKQADEPVIGNGHPGEYDPIGAGLYGAFNTATEFLESLAGRLAAERDRLRAEGQVDEVDADKILGLQTVAASLHFAGVPVGGSGVATITATITTHLGDLVLDVGKLDPATDRSAIPNVKVSTNVNRTTN